MLFQNAAKKNDSPAVGEIDRGEAPRPGPLSSGPMDPLKVEAELLNRRKVAVMSRHTAPVCIHKSFETLMGQPRVFKSEDSTAGGFRRSLELNGNVVRGGTMRGCEGGVWEDKAPIGVDKGPDLAEQG